MDAISIAGFIGYMGIGLGIFLIGRGNHWGLFSQMIGSVIWFVTGWFMQDGWFPIVFWNGIFTFTCGYGFLRLHKEKKNEDAFDFHKPQISKIQYGKDLKELRDGSSNAPENQGKPLSDNDKKSICIDYERLRSEGTFKKDAINRLSSKYGRGRFSIINIIKENLDKYSLNYKNELFK